MALVHHDLRNRVLKNLENLENLENLFLDGEKRLLEILRQMREPGTLPPFD